MKKNEVSYNIQTVASLLGVSRASVYNRMKSGEFPNVKQVTRGQEVPSGDVWDSRKLERDKLVDRLDALDVLDSAQYKMES